MEGLDAVSFASDLAVFFEEVFVSFLSSFLSAFADPEVLVLDEDFDVLLAAGFASAFAEDLEDVFFASAFLVDAFFFSSSSFLEAVFFEADFVDEAFVPLAFAVVFFVEVSFLAADFLPDAAALLVAVVLVLLFNHLQLIQD